MIYPHGMVVTGRLTPARRGIGQVSPPSPGGISMSDGSGRKARPRGRNAMSPRCRRYSSMDPSSLCRATNIGQHVADPMIVARPNHLTRGAAENTNRHQPPGSAFFLTDQLEPAHNRVRTNSSISLGAQSGHSPHVRTPSTTALRRKPKAKGWCQATKSRSYPISADRFRLYSAG